MERRTFLRHGCLACLSALAVPSLLSGCAGSAHITGTLSGEDLVVPRTAFGDMSTGKQRAFIVVHQASLRYPIAVFRASGDAYQAVLLRCTHQGAELRATEDALYCPSHGSTFSPAGAVVKGPATEALRTLPVRSDAQDLFISLKKA